MSLPRRLRHRTARKQLVREALYCYAIAFGFVFLDSHFVGIRHYYPVYHREYLPVNAAALRATFFAIIGPALWVLQDVLESNEACFVLGLRQGDQRACPCWRSYSLCGCCVALDAAIVRNGSCHCPISTFFAAKRQPVVLLAFTDHPSGSTPTLWHISKRRRLRDTDAVAGLRGRRGSRDERNSCR
jgi:hypothetical protein